MALEWIFITCIHTLHEESANIFSSLRTERAFRNSPAAGIQFFFYPPSAPNSRGRMRHTDLTIFDVMTRFFMKKKEKEEARENNASSLFILNELCKPLHSVGALFPRGINEAEFGDLYN